MLDASVVIMAAGEGKRMKSLKAKVLHEICGRAIIDWVMDAVAPVQPIVVVGHRSDEVSAHIKGRAFTVMQEQPLGTGHAVMQAAPLLKKEGKGYTVILAGDMPLVTDKTITQLYAAAKDADAAFATAVLENPAGYGRVVPVGESAAAIVEDRDCNDEQRRICEVNASVYCFKTDKLLECLSRLKADNAQGEYYLTDCVGMLEKVRRVVISADESMGVNSKAQLSEAATAMRKRINIRHMDEGVEIIDPAATYIDYGAKIGRDTIVYPGNYIQNRTIIGENCTLYPGSRISGGVISDGVVIQNSVILDSSVGSGSSIGPYAYLRPGSKIGEKCRIGDFVEVKNSDIGDGSKVSHLSYIGDGSIGEGCNIGCGVVFVNYDGKRKSRTVIEDDVFVGCNANLVAPVTIGEGAYVAAGSTVTEDVPPGALCIARARQTIKTDWKLRED
ncbi:MAG: bifunctional UDP-N-acetylglucosamine diphosphorylase/glucosamine-1-phosphate N-acetyltransferase GlmU [Christensenellales bacterium]|jgi:bifunctional UDP-N-acetylglucosamine pyrophosphorylase/glucosamine-1-phosphate N-acetyltransferase